MEKQAANKSKEERNEDTTLITVPRHTKKEESSVLAKAKGKRDNFICSNSNDSDAVRKCVGPRKYMKKTIKKKDNNKDDIAILYTTYTDKQKRRLL